jgi:hypothetical protein
LANAPLAPDRFEDTDKGLLADILNSLGGPQTRSELDEQEPGEVGNKVFLRYLVTVAEPLQIGSVKGK